MSTGASPAFRWQGRRWVCGQIPEVGSGSMVLCLPVVPPPITERPSGAALHSSLRSPRSAAQHWESPLRDRPPKPVTRPPQLKAVLPRRMGSAGITPRPRHALCSRDDDGRHAAHKERLSGGPKKQPQPRPKKTSEPEGANPSPLFRAKVPRARAGFPGD